MNDKLIEVEPTKKDLVSSNKSVLLEIEPKLDHLSTEKDETPIHE